MKVKLKIDPETLYLVFGVVRTLNFNEITRTRTRADKIRKSMHQELFEMLSKRMVNYSANPNGKLREFEIRYHLASEILNIITNDINYSGIGINEANKLEILKNQLHQKLL